MAEIDSVSSNSYFSGISSTSREIIKRNSKSEDTKSVKRKRFSDIFNPVEEKQPEFSMQGLPPEIATMSIDEAAIYLKDAVDNAGNNLSENITEENIKQFKSAVGQFILFVVNNNYEVKSHRRKNRLGRDMIVPSRTNFFSNYSLPPHRIDPRYQILTINRKLSALTASTLESQKGNLIILQQIDEIKGLIIDLMSS